MFDIFRNYLTSKIFLTEEELKMIETVSVFKKLRKRQYLLQEGDVWKMNAFVCQGCMRTYRVDDKGAEHILNFAVENWWTGDRESLMTGNPAKSNIDALEDSVILLIEKERLENLSVQIPVLNNFLNNILQKSFNVSQNRIIANISYTAEEKYLNFIETRPEIANRVPQHMIASYLGISPETLSRVRNQIAKK